MTELLVVHDLAAPGGAEWRSAFASWDGPVAAPDLPGHGDAPRPLGGHYELGDAAYAVLEVLAHREVTDRVVVGVGGNGGVARLLALGGRAVALVLVDGLGGPWLDVRERDRLGRDARRRILETPGAVGPPPPGEIDPRAALTPPNTDRDFLVRQAEAMPVPTLVVETPGSPTPDAAVLVRHFPDGELVEVPSGSPATIAAAVIDWWARR